MKWVIELIITPMLCTVKNIVSSECQYKLLVFIYSVYNCISPFHTNVDIVLITVLTSLNFSLII